MKAGLVHAPGRHHGEPAHRFHPDRDTGERGHAVRPMALAGGQHGGHDDGARVYRPSLERIVEILAMRRGAVHKRRVGGAEPARMADRGARPIVIAGRERRLHIVFAPRSKAQPDDIDRHILAFRPHCQRQARRVDRGNPLGQRFGDGERARVVRLRAGYVQLETPPARLLCRIGRGLRATTDAGRFAA